MTTIAAVHGVLPPHRYPQPEITEMFGSLLADPARVALLRRLHESAQVRTRHLVLPLDRYPELAGFGQANDEYIRHAVALGADALAAALEDAGLRAADVDVVFFTTVTGVAAPSIEARIAGIVGLRPDVKRVPMFGLGCVAGAAGVARLHDYLRGAPNEVAVLLSVELCSLTMQRHDDSTANLVATGLFGDGAAAVVAVGGDRVADVARVSGPQIIDSRSHLYPDSQRTMGWDVTASGLKIVLNADVPDLVRKYLGADVRAFLATHGLTAQDVSTWVSHPGGPKIIEAIEEALQLPPDALELTWRSLAGVGNLSSASVLHVLSDTLHKQPPAGTPGLLMAMGPGFCSELVLLRWT
ncbi:MAG TPA: 3-oxoacyl-[acyl-carrier-protein] synthase III C-terminal domain-containing protein [Jatrophihabitans sp.]|nr:3-oxoacyl-[acyl-carrier-protein] synthase III C-terminal domain-containing protein [Jatrophihabitans sp.]